MKKLILSILLFATNSMAGEVITREMFCDDTLVIAKQLREKYGEMPIISGKADDAVGSLMTIWINPKSESWSIVSTYGDYSCIIGVGEKLKVIDVKRKNI